MWGASCVRLDGDQLSLVQRYVDSLERRDIDSLVSLLR